jgi:diguanylate cyclase (GGDEF)-like protein
VRCLFAAWLLSLAALLSNESLAQGSSGLAHGSSGLAHGSSGLASPAEAAVAPAPALEVQLLTPGTPGATVAAVTSGSLDAQFRPFAGRAAPSPAEETLWFRVRARQDFKPPGVVVLIGRGGWYERIQAFPAGTAVSEPLPHATDLREFGGAHHSVFMVPGGLTAGQSLYLQVSVKEDGIRSLRFTLSTLAATLRHAAAHSRMIALAVGALTAMAVGSLLIWFILKDRLFLLYPGMFLLEALYLAYFSGEGFDWPLLWHGRAISAFTWNVPVALSGAMASLFIREIADLRHSSPRVYRIFGALAWVFVALAFSNLAHFIGLGGLVATIGNLVFVGTAIFTLVVAFLAWRRGNRAAGWFLIAWGMLETFAIVTAIRLLFDRAENAEGLLYYGLPFSMVAAAILVALGVADRLREQRVALSEAERRAQTDPLTGVLNRRSLIERLDAACLRARARGLPIALLFIDLDHFKEINDTFGHAAGDSCLNAIIAPIQAELRQSDVIGRYGGEEFVVILSSADIAAAHPIAERIRNRVANVAVEGFGKQIRLTCSIGVATSDTLGVWGEHLIAQADAAVYAAKRSGRNRVQVAIAQAA